MPRSETKDRTLSGAAQHPNFVYANRRQMLQSFAGGVGALALRGMLSDLDAGETRANEGADRAIDPLAPKTTHRVARAKRVIFLWMTGGVSHVESFDPKPKLARDHGKPVPIDNWQGRLGTFRPFLKGPHFGFQRGGESGIPVSDLFPHVRRVVDDLCVIRSMSTDHTNHFESTLGMHTGSFSFARPSLGAWVSYGLGTENRNLPSFVVVAPKAPYAGNHAWGADFLPGCHQGTRVVPGDVPIANIQRRTASRLQQLELGLLGQANAQHRSERPGEAALEAQIRAFETAFGMQIAAPEAFDISRETDATLGLYGLERGQTSGYGWQCLVGRRLIERGVRFVELVDFGSSGGNWDSHGDMQGHVPKARYVDQAIAGLIADLKARGLLDETLVVWTTEFGRTPYNMVKNHKGREHHHQCFSSWLAGGGVKPGITYGATDEYGIDVAEKKVHVHDFHATLLHLLGLDHERLTYRHAGRDFRLTDVYGKVVKDILA